MFEFLLGTWDKCRWHGPNTDCGTSENFFSRFSNEKNKINVDLFYNWKVFLTKSKLLKTSEIIDIWPQNFENLRIDTTWFRICYFNRGTNN